MIYTFPSIYLIVSFLSFRWINKTKILDGNKKVLNYILVLILPIIWIVILKFINKPTPGSYIYQNKHLYDNN